MIITIFIHFQAILRKSSLTAGMFLKALSNPFSKSTIPLGYPKILMIVGLIIIFITLTAKQYFHAPVSRHENQNKKCKKWCYVYRKLGITQKFNIEDTKERSQIRVMEVKKVIYGETL